MQMNRPPRKLPGSDYLIRFGTLDGDKPTHVFSEHCGCKSTHPMAPSGSWLVLHEGKLYAFDPCTQLQKDIWIGSARKTVGEDRALAMLRWYCFGCNTVQMP